MKLHASDNVAVLIEACAAGEEVQGITARQRIPRGHKMALAAVPEGAEIVKYGQIIGFASRPIAPGEWVHEHNVGLHDFTRDYQFSEDRQLTNRAPASELRTFRGYRRPNGKWGTRNYIAVLTSVNCSATAARHIAGEVGRSGGLKS